MSGDDAAEKDDAAALVPVISGALGIPVPKSVTIRLLKALGMLVTGAVEWPVAWLESRAQGIRDDMHGRTDVSKHAARAAALAFEKDPALVDRATKHFGARILREQENREAVAEAAVEELRANPPIDEDAPDNKRAEISDDWMSVFSRVAEQRSDRDMQLHLAKLLAAEIRAPGAFDTATVQILATLSPRVAQLFQAACNISSRVLGAPVIITSPFGSAGQNALKPWGLGFAELSDLQDAGLIQADLGAWKEITAIAFSAELPREFAFEVAGQRVVFGPPLGEHLNPGTKVRLTIVNFTNAGVQLRGIVHMTPIAPHVEALQQWIATAYSVRPVPNPGAVTPPQ